MVATASKLQAKTGYCSRRVVSIIERIDLGCAGNPMRVLINLKAPPGTPIVTTSYMLGANFQVPVFEQFAHKHSLIDRGILATCDLLGKMRLEAEIAIHISRNPGDTLKGLAF